jgi:hypothetical protein
MDPRSRFVVEHPAIAAGCLGALALPFVGLLGLLLLFWPTPGAVTWPAAAAGCGLWAAAGTYSLRYWSVRHQGRSLHIWDPWLGAVLIVAPLALLLLPAEQLHVAATTYLALWCVALSVWGLGTGARRAISSQSVAGGRREPPVHEVNVCEVRPEDVTGEPLYMAACGCGWVGEEHVASDPDAGRKAFADAHSHSRHVSPAIRRPNRKNAG